MSEHSWVLLAEDDENDVFFLERAFKEAGIRNPLSVTRNGQEAIDYLSGAGKFADRRKYPLPCFIILDLKMPIKTGMEVLEWLKESPSLRPLPTMVFSSSAQKDDVEKAYTLGANAFVTKPASVEARTELAKLIRGFWLTFNLAPPICHGEV